MEKYNFSNYPHLRSLFHSLVDCIRSWALNKRWAAYTKPESVCCVCTLIELLFLHWAGGSGWITCAAMCFGSGKRRGIGRNRGSSVWEAPGVHSQHQPADLTIGLKLAVLVCAIFVNWHCGQGVSFGVALPPPCLASERNRCSGATWALWNDRLLREQHWGVCSEGYSLQKVSFPRFFPSGKIGDSCWGVAHIGKHAPGLHNRRKQVPDGARSVSHCLALQWAIVQPSLESLFVLEWLLSDCFHQTTHAPPWTPTGPPRSENHSCRESRRGWEVKWYTDTNLCTVQQGLKWDVRNLWLWPCSVLNEKLI